MATKLAAKGSISQFTGNNPRFRCIKLSHGSFAIEGSIIVTQLGNKYFAGENVVQGRDFTLNATKAGIVVFSDKIIRQIDKKGTVIKKKIKEVSVVSVV